MKHLSRLASMILAGSVIPQAAWAVSSAELYRSGAYVYGRFEARIRYAAGDGVVSSFFLWKEGSDAANAFWNELDFEKIAADCHMQTNAIYGNPSTQHSQVNAMPGDICNGYHDYRFEWTPTYIAWSVDGQEVRRDTGATATAFSQNASSGMTFHFNVWPGNADFGGNFSASILPVREYISWVAYSSYSNGSFKSEWREEFDSGSLPSGWSKGDWPSPYSLSTHSPSNVSFVNGIAVLSLTADGATGFTGTPPADSAGTGGTSAGGTGSGGTSSGGNANQGGTTTTSNTIGPANGGTGGTGGRTTSVTADAGGAATGGTATGPGTSQNPGQGGTASRGGASSVGSAAAGRDSSRGGASASGSSVVAKGGATTGSGSGATSLAQSTAGGTSATSGTASSVAHPAVGGASSSATQSSSGGASATSVGGSTMTTVSGVAASTSSASGAGDDGCNCRVSRPQGSTWALAGLGLLGAFLARLRRQRAQR
jgi:endo-1,3-1,4-beta-glycanase ExoK